LHEKLNTTPGDNSYSQNPIKNLVTISENPKTEYDGIQPEVNNAMPAGEKSYI